MQTAGFEALGMQGWDFGVTGLGAIVLVLALGRRLRDHPARFVLATCGWTGPNLLCISALGALGPMGRDPTAGALKLTLVIVGMGLTFFLSGYCSMALALWAAGPRTGRGCVMVYGVGFGLTVIGLLVCEGQSSTPQGQQFLGLMALWPLGQLLGSRRRP